MNTRIKSLVWATELGGSSIKAVALNLAMLAEKEVSDVCPDLHNLTRETQLCKRTVQCALASLVRRGVLIQTAIGGRGPGSRNSFRFDVELLERMQVETERKWQEWQPEYQKVVIPTALRLTTFDRDGWCCKHCGSEDDLCADHIIPESRGGPTTLDNLQTLCRSCNSRKGTRLL